MPNPKKLKPFVDLLPIPPTMPATKKNKKGTYYEVKMTEFFQQLHRDLPPTRLWGYNGTYPGPTLEVNRNENVYVKWMNQLPTRHILPVDQSIHGAGKDTPLVRTVTHIHGSVCPASSDGHSEAWFTKGYAKTGPKFGNKVKHYPNHQRSGTLWYHDHALGITRLNVYAGLAGFYLIRDKQEEALNLPKGKYEIPLLIQDRSFNADGSLFYPSQPTPASAKMPYPSIVPGFTGNTVLVNGKVWPYCEVEPRKYRFRILNGSNSRFYTISLDSGQSFIQIGADSRLLPSPVRMKSITLAPAERADVIIDFSQFKGKTITLTNSDPHSSPEDTIPHIMQFRVLPSSKAKDTSSIPRKLSALKSFPIQSSKKTRQLTIVQTTDDYGRVKHLLNNHGWHHPATETPTLGDIEIWNFINPTGHIHPMHLHLTHFQILYRRPFDVEHFNKTGKLRFTGPAKAPERNERGLKDVVRVNPGEIAGIITQFDSYTGEFMWHCHLLEHEDYDMMRPLNVLPNPSHRSKKSRP